MTDCGCIVCTDKRAMAAMQADPKLILLRGMEPGFRYACEICGNKRCPHHTWHENACTNSNEPGQKGSVYE